MNLFPPMPSWEAAHPIVVHFPIALLMVAWAPIVIGLVDRPRRTAWMLAGLLALVAGTGMAFVAVMSGEATEDKAVITAESVERLVHDHEEMAELARNLFVAVTALFAVLLGLGAGLKKGGVKRGVLIVGSIVLLGLYAFGASRLAWAGHMGGELVHAHGVRAPMAPGPAAPASVDRDDD